MKPQDFGIYGRSISHAYGSSTVLDGADLALIPGELYGLLGRNGAGKSTAIRALCGFMKPDHGEIFVSGVDVIKDPVSARRHIGVVSEDVEVYEKLSAMDFLVFAGQMHGLSHAQARSRTDELLTLLDLTGAASRAISGYSLGMKKKTAFAAALIHAPRVLFLDEPFNGVDAASTRCLCSLLTGLTTGKGITILFTSHVTEMIERICTRIGFLHEGKIHTEQELRTQCGSSAETLDDLLFELCGGNLKREYALDWYQ